MFCKFDKSLVFKFAKDEELVDKAHFLLVMHFSEFVLLLKESSEIDFFACKRSNSCSILTGFREIKIEAIFLVF